jgi:hypothetical protein
MADLAHSDQLVRFYSAGLSRMAERLANGDLTLTNYHQGFKDVIDAAWANQTLAAVGGDPSALTDADRERLRQGITGQYGYLDNFMSDIEAALKSGDPLDFVKSRATMYAGSAQAAYWQQLTAAANLPAHPKDGSTPCLSNCGCHWVQRDGSWYWERDKNDSCDVCVWREAHWNPYNGEQDGALPAGSEVSE